MGGGVKIVTLWHLGFLLDLSSILSLLYQPLTRGFLTEYLTFHKARAIMNLAESLRIFAVFLMLSVRQDRAAWGNFISVWRSPAG